MALPFPRNTEELLFTLVQIGVTLTEQDQQKIRDNVIATDAEADAITDESRQRDEIARNRQG